MSDIIKFPSLNGDKILEQYPLSVKEFQKFIGALPNINNAEVDALLYDQGIKAIFYYNPRTLYEFFDDKKLELLIDKPSHSWQYSVNDPVVMISSVAGFKSRIEAEESGFQECFEILEKQLIYENVPGK